MHDDQNRTIARIRRALDLRLRPRAIGEREACEVWAFYAGDQVDVADALAAAYVPVERGAPWGAPWSTTWFRLSGKVPAEWAGKRVEAVFDLGFNDRNPGFQAEGLAFSSDGTPIKAVSPRNNWLPVDNDAGSGGSWTCFVEAVAMPSIMGSTDDRFRPTDLGDVATAGPKPLYALGGADLVVVDEEARALVLDVEVLLGVLEQLGTTDPRRHEILRALERSLDVYDLGEDAGPARQVLREVLSAPAARTAHRISAVGHAHIDSAWLWPVRETVRKCARTFANVAALGQEFPELVFACSQAQQWFWTKHNYPAIYEGMKEQVTRGQIVPVGGMWVESDTNVTGSESLVRQLVFGKRFFLSELGVETEEVWLPDCFGYSAAFPQLILLSGSRWFLTQKLSWNDTNKFPHHTFWWEGIDGSRVFTHFPPVDTYNARLLPSELAHASSNYAEVGFGTRSLAPFGYGDGGGGPNREMMERARRLANLDGSPKVAVEPPAEFFQAAYDEYPDAPVWSGELYLELHRGTISNQVEIKQGNRRCENLVREAELWSTAALVAGRWDYPYDELEEIWRDILLNQFHDILPGSSIAWVNDEAIASFAHSAARLEGLIEKAISALGGQDGRTSKSDRAGGAEVGGTEVGGTEVGGTEVGGTEVGDKGPEGSGVGDGAAPEVAFAFNPAPHAQRGVPAMSAGAVAPTVGVARLTGKSVLENDRIRVELNEDGHIVSLIDRVAGREMVPEGTQANVLQLHPDLPNKWPAWDIDAFYRNTKTDLTSPQSIVVIADGPEEVAIQVEYLFGASRAVQTLRLAADGEALVVETQVDWHEHDRLLKVAVPVDVHADQSVSEIQFGHVKRPTHNNTSWDDARFEFVAHRFMYVGEPGYGVAIVNDGIYGHEARALERDGGGRATLARLTIIRGASFPDPRGENGTHHFRYAIVPGASVADAVRHGYQFNLPLHAVPVGTVQEPLVSVANEAVVVEAVKAADDRSGDVVVRCYESLGGRATTTVTASFGVAGAAITDLLERPLADVAVSAGNQVVLDLKPFQVVTLRLSRGT